MEFTFGIITAGHDPFISKIIDSIEVAQYENIVYLHDYISLETGWYEGFCQFGNDGWDVAMCRMIENNGARAMDWMGLPSDPLYGNVLHPYDYYNPQGMYVPGNFFVVKKEFILNNPLDLTRGWCDGEDIEWSKRIFGGVDNSEWLRNILRIPMDIVVPEPERVARYKNPTPCNNRESQTTRQLHTKCLDPSNQAIILYWRVFSRTPKRCVCVRVTRQVSI